MILFKLGQIVQITNFKSTAFVSNIISELHFRISEIILNSSAISLNEKNLGGKGGFNILSENMQISATFMQHFKNKAPIISRFLHLLSPSFLRRLRLKSNPLKIIFHARLFKSSIWEDHFHDNRTGLGLKKNTCTYFNCEDPWFSKALDFWGEWTEWLKKKHKGKPEHSNFGIKFEHYIYMSFPFR